MAASTSCQGWGIVVYQMIRQLIAKGAEGHLIEPEDKICARNQILALLGLTEFKPAEAASTDKADIPDLLNRLVEYAISQHIINDIFDEKEILASKIMNCLIARPSTVNRTFNEKYGVSPAAATDYFYELSKNSTYIQTKRVQKNIEYKVSTEYGELDITINLSKPEKDPRSIELERAAVSTEYPKCLLCVENEGYSGRIGHPARANHRMIRVNLLEENWMLQFSPYVYYPEHCIVLSEKHIGMSINSTTFQRLLCFVALFPHYFLGSNADLPIVGGSILSHEHYQGGHYTFAMAKAKADYRFNLVKFPSVDCSVVKWPMSVIRLRSQQFSPLIDVASHLLTEWRNYSEEALGILANTGETYHNTITPIARKNGLFFELDLVLRNNRTSAGHPLGIFHPHADVQHIKKENIGLIEVMGLAVLPARLKDELKEVENYILGESASVADYHAVWAEELKARYQRDVTKANVEDIVREEVGKKYLKCLEDAAVFKRDEQGRKGFQRFIQSVM